MKRTLAALSFIAALAVSSTAALADPPPQGYDGRGEVITPASWATVAKNLFFDCIEQDSIDPDVQQRVGDARIAQMYKICMNFAGKAQKDCERDRNRSAGCDGPIPP